MCDLLRQAKYTIDSLEEELRLTRIGRDSCNKFLFYKEEECAALQKKLSAAEAKVEKVKVAFDKCRFYEISAFKSRAGRGEVCRREIDASQVVMAIEQILK